MESVNDEGDAGPEQQLISQQPRYSFIKCSVVMLLIDQRVVSLFPQESLASVTCECQNGETVTTLSHICFLKSAFKQKGGCLQFI